MTGTVIPFRRYRQLGAPVRVSIQGDFVTAPQLDENARRRLADAHIDIFEQKLRMLNPHLRIDEATKNRIRSIAMDPHNTSPEAIMQSVIAATSETMPASAQDHRERFQSQYDIDGHKHHSDTARQMMRMAFDRYASGGRYGELGAGELSQSDLQNMAAARATAQDLGMAWALNNPELLKLGPGAIKTLHEAGVERGRFERMTGKSVGFDASTAVEIAAFARRHNLTPEQTNKLYDKISDGVEVISGGNKTIQGELRDATRAYVTGSDTPETRRALEEAYYKPADTPEKREAAERTIRALEEAARQTHEREAKADAKTAAAGASEAREDGGFAELNNPQGKAEAAPKASTTVGTPPKQAPKAPAPKQ